MADPCSRTLRGWLLGCLTATAAIEIFFMLAVISQAIRISEYRMIAMLVILLAWAPVICFVVCALSAIPAILAILLSKKLRIQSIFFFCCAGAVIGAGTPTLLFRYVPIVSGFFGAAGCLAGLSYWYAAGRYTGQDDLEFIACGPR